jgi:hypothetical protein
MAILYLPSQARSSPRSLTDKIVIRQKGSPINCCIYPDFIILVEVGQAAALFTTLARVWITVQNFP